MYKNKLQTDKYNNKQTKMGNKYTTPIVDENFDYEIYDLINKIINNTEKDINDFITSSKRENVFFCIIILKEKIEKCNIIKFKKLTKIRNIIAHDLDILKNIEKIHNLIINDLIFYSNKFYIQENIKIKIHIKDLQEKMKMLKNDEFQEKIKNITKSRDSLKINNKDLKTSNNNLTKQSEDLKTSNNNLTKQTKDLKTSNNNLTKQTEDLKTSNNNLTKQTEDLKKKFCLIYLITIISFILIFTT